jgi:hypothetical protein
VGDSVPKGFWEICGDIVAIVTGGAPGMELVEAAQHPATQLRTIQACVHHAQGKNLL